MTLASDAAHHQGRALVGIGALGYAPDMGHALAWCTSGMITLAASTLSCGGPPSSAVTPQRPAPAATASAPNPGLVRPELVLVGSAPAPIPLNGTPLEPPLFEVPVAPFNAPNVRARVPPYRLPIQRDRLVNLQRDLLAKNILDEPERAVEMLLRDGVAVLPGASRSDRFVAAYETLERASIPTVVTTDSVLHAYHLFFAEILKAIETRALLPHLEALVVGLYDEVLEIASKSDGELVEPALSELVFLGVARRLFDPEFEPHPDVRARVEADIGAIAAHKTFCNSAALSSEGCLRKLGTACGRVDPRSADMLRCYIEDFSQYKVRGHYAQSDDLQRYFRVAMWLGRLGHRVRYSSEVLQQAILLQAFKQARCRVGEDELAAAEVHARIDRVLAFLIGKTDDLTLAEVDPVFRQNVPGSADLRRVAQVETMRKLRTGLRKLRPPRILSTVLRKQPEDEVTDAVTEHTQSLRVLGQRYAADSEMLGRFVFGHVGVNPTHPAVAKHGYRCEELSLQAQQRICEGLLPHGIVDACRTLPTGLDVAAVLGSALAEEYTRPSEAYCGYAEQRAQLRDAWEQEHSSASTTLYLGWLTALRPLLQPVSTGYPTWMRGRAYQKKALRTALASWAELRHDTLLYVKQSYTPALVRISETVYLGRPERYGLVEPQPEVYAHLQRLAVQTRMVLEALQMLPEEVAHSLRQAERIYARLIAITEKQLGNEPLSGEDEQYIKSFGGRLQAMVTQLTVAITPPTRHEEPRPLESYGTDRKRVEGQQDAFKTTVVADVHSDPTTMQVLEEGLGPIEWMVVVNRTADGQLSVAVGPVFSYYEFVHPLSDRLTDEQWRATLQAGAASAPRWWTHDEPIDTGYRLPNLR